MWERQYHTELRGTSPLIRPLMGMDGVRFSVTKNALKSWKLHCLCYKTLSFFYFGRGHPSNTHLSDALKLKNVRHAWQVLPWSLIQRPNSVLLHTHHCRRTFLSHHFRIRPCKSELEPGQAKSACFFHKWDLDLLATDLVLCVSHNPLPARVV